MATPTSPPGSREGDVLAAGECPRCGTPYERFQEYCLECGLRLPRDATTREALAAAAGRPSPRYAGDWLWPVLVTLVVAVLTAVAAVAIAATRDDDELAFLEATTAQTDQILTGTAPESPGISATEPAPSVTLPEEEQPPPETEPLPPPPPQARRVIAWPGGRNGFTVVLASVPEGGRAQATQKAKQASDAGLNQVGVLDSSRYPSLHPGYLVVFSGVYQTLEQARAASARARDRGYRDAYAAQVAR
jgi:hypothetical protein